MWEWFINLVDSPEAKAADLLNNTQALWQTLKTLILGVLRRFDRRIDSKVKNCCEQLNNDSEKVRLDAYLKLIDYGHNAVLPLVDVLKGRTCKAQELALKALCEIGVHALKPLLEARREAHIVGHIDDALGNFRPPASQLEQMVDKLIVLMDDKDEIVQEGAALALGRYPQLPQLKVIRALGQRVYPTECKNGVMRETVVRSLGETKAPAAVAYLVIALKDHSPGVRQAACEALDDISRQQKNPLLGQALEDAIPALRTVLLPDPDLEPRIAAALTLGRSGDPIAKDILVRVAQSLDLDDDSPRTLREAVGNALFLLQSRGTTGG
ncbi:MAG: HEAT repeat domain-containing protein [Candidatus Entotheonellia bacterium]